MHYGKYVAQYLKRTFFFDANPPLGKLLIASVAYFADFDGESMTRIDPDLLAAELCSCLRISNL